MPSSREHPSSTATSPQPIGPFGAAVDYAVDAAQRSVLFWDVMRQRGNQYREHLAETAPHVLDYAVELLVDGRTLERPVNYALVRVVPPKGVEIDPTRRPFVIVDPRAGHGPGIGGFKADSEIGVAFKAGHPCYFIGFLPDPMPGQTIEDIARAEAVFLEKVIALHPEADGKPCVIGNCQAGWAVMMLAVVAPGIVRPDHHRRLAAVVLGRRARQVSDALQRRATGRQLAHGLGRRSRSRQVRRRLAGAEFRDIRIPRTRCGASSTISIPRSTPRRRAIWASSAGGAGTSTSTPRKSSSSSTSCSSATISPPDGFRRRTAPRSTFATSAPRSWCSARRATTSRRRSRRSDGFSISTRTSTRSAPMARPSSTPSTRRVGHLGIFVSGGVAKKEHGEFSSNIDLIDTLPPGLYEAVFESKTEDYGQPRSRDRQLGDALRGEDPGRHPRARRQRCGRRAPVRDRRPRLGDEPRALSHVRAADGPRPGRALRWRNGCSSCTRCGCNTSSSPMRIR